MTRTDALMLTVAALALMAFECQLHAPGAPIAYDSPYYDDVTALADDWRVSDLPSIETQRCADALADIEIRTATEREWIDELRLCPMMPDGCSTAPGCAGDVCATGTVMHHHGQWLVYLSPGEDASGHRITTQHEVAHVLSWCTTGALDYGHTDADVWGGAGVVWRAP